MNISIEDIGKKYQGANWIFRNINYELETGGRLAVTGNNGSGKSTLLKIVAGSVLASEGTIAFDGQAGVHPIHQISFTAPYLELIQDFTVAEQISFHYKFRNYHNCDNELDLLSILYLEAHKNKLVKSLSSGMQQRLKIGLALHSEADLYLLDEPTTNMDNQGIDWYQKQIEGLGIGKSLVVASNQKHEYDMCDKMLKIE